KKATEKALGEMIKMRRREGAAMAADMKRRLRTITTLTRSIMRDAPQVLEKYRQRLKSRIAELVDSPANDTGRLEMEITLFADKCDISEECTRLLSHIDLFTHALAEDKPVGKTLTFILQEMNRESNTIASKSPDTNVAGAVIALKEELEKLRELAQNAE
ncbi:MAG TPA: DUF1732 domain-containing protein, partial [Candidatus Deferrimicrobium sp.]|nr:DUF1732 domain-containing protein [Candidatus Deferrimicrobium sp.]